MAAPRRKNVLRSIRIAEELDEVIQADAANRGLTTNALISMILRKYAEWDRYVERFGFVTITRDGFRSFIEAIDDARLAQLGLELGARNPKEMTLFWFKKLNVQTFLAYLTLYCRYGRIAEFELAAEGRDYTITIHHDLGPKYSTYLARFFDQAVRSIVGVVPRFEVGRNALTMRFTAP